MNIFLVSLLLLFGVALLVVEMFLIPGVGIAGVFSALSLSASVALAYYLISPMAGHVTLFAVLVVAVVAVVAFLKGKTLDKMALQTNVDSRVDLIAGSSVQAGQEGLTVSRLAPMGKVRVGEEEFEAKSLSSFIEEQTPVSVVKIEGNVLIVKSLK